MAHFKRRRPKNRRAGCLFCKPHKGNHAPKTGAGAANPISVQRRLQDDRDRHALSE